MKRNFSIKFLCLIAATCSVAATLASAHQQIIDAPPPADFVLGPYDQIAVIVGEFHCD